MSINNELSHMNFLGKIKFIIGWIKEPKGYNKKSTLKIYYFKISHLSKIMKNMISEKSLKRAITEGGNNFLRSEIKTIAKSREGYLFNISSGEDLDIIRTTREEFVNSFFKPSVGDIIIDVGANIGSYAIKASKLVSKKGKIFAIEADPNTFEKLKKNIKLNNLENVIPINIAIYNTKKNMKFFKSELSVSNSLLSQEGKNSINIQAEILDNVIQEFNPPSIEWLMIDVEGVEIEVLEGAKGILATNPNLKIILEIHDIKNKDRIEEILSKNNFKFIHENHEKSTWWHIYAEKK